MRLVAYEFSGAAAPVAAGFLELDDLTILFGANDTGKSRLLATIAEGADALDAMLRGDGFTGNHRFFAKLHQDDAKLLLRRTYRIYREDLRSQGVEDEPEPTGFPEDPPWLRYLPEEARELAPNTSTFAFEVLDECADSRPVAHRDYSSGGAVRPRLYRGTAPTQMKRAC